MKFEFATAGRIVFGKGVAREIAPIASQMGHNAFVVTGRDGARGLKIMEMLKKQGMGVVSFGVSGEPTTKIALKGVEKARQAGCDTVIGIGGGSVLDAGKVIAALMTNPGEIHDYLEVIGRGGEISNPAAPYVAVPTTAGTGAEVTRNAVIGSTEHRVKVSMRSPMMLPRLAVVDPLLTLSMPKEITAATGLDALTQLIEAFVSSKANPLTDGICREGMQRAARSLERAYCNGDDPEARENMCVASLFGGLALANAKLGAVHGFAGPMGGMFTVPHGIVCARLLPGVIEANVHALKNREPDSEALARYDEIARILTGESTSRAADGVAWVQELCSALSISPLKSYAITADDFSLIVEKSKKASSMKTNPIVLTDDELTQILQKECRTEQQ